MFYQAFIPGYEAYKKLFILCIIIKIKNYKYSK